MGSGGGVNVVALVLVSKNCTLPSLIETMVGTRQVATLVGFLTYN